MVGGGAYIHQHRNMEERIQSGKRFLSEFQVPKGFEMVTTTITTTMTTYLPLHCFSSLSIPLLLSLYLSTTTYSSSSSSFSSYYCSVYQLSIHYPYHYLLIMKVFDSMDGEACDRYDAWPERLYIVLNGVIVYKGNGF